MATTKRWTGNARKWMRGSTLVFAYLLAALACGTEPPVAELCNGIDDNGDGRIDEGCPCTPFSVDVPFRVNAAVSLGDGWALVTNDLTATSATTTHAGYARIDDSGTVQITRPLDGVMWGWPRQFAWNGAEIAYLSGSLTEAHVAFLTPDGAKAHDGPAVDVAVHAPSPALTPRSRIVATATGYDIAYSIFAGSTAPIARFASTDRDGNPTIPTITAPGGAGSFTFALGSLGGTTAVGWAPIVGGGAKDGSAYVGPPFSGGAVVATQFEGFFPDASGTDGDGDGDGTAMVMILHGAAFGFDGATVTPEDISGTLKTIAWTGASYEIARLTFDGTNLGLDDVRLARDRSFVSSHPVLAVPATSADLDVSDATVSADVRRALFGLFYQQNGARHQTLIQVCL